MITIQHGSVAFRALTAAVVHAAEVGSDVHLAVRPDDPHVDSTGQILVKVGGGIWSAPLDTALVTGVRR